MTIELQIFAGLKDYIHNYPEFEFTDGCDLKELIEQLKISFPNAKGLLEKSRVAVNNQFVEPTFVLKLGDVVALIPPSSGG